MPYLDVTPLITALHRSPQDFELSGNWLQHIRSRHSFRVTGSNRVELSASCDCALLAVNPEQEPEFAARFREWRTTYWRAIEINRDFASHFAPRPRVLQWMVDASGKLHRWLMRQGRGRPALSIVSARPTS